MLLRRFVIHGPNQTSIERVNVEPGPNQVLVKVRYSGICKTDLSVLSGDLSYYKNGTARYPITTGHEWCGEYNGVPATSLCIVGCGGCLKCNTSEIYCDNRKELGIVNYDGAHGEYVIVDTRSLVEIHEMSSKMALIEPLAVVLRGLNKLYSLNRSHKKFYVNGYGSLGKLICLALEEHGYDFVCNDPLMHKNVVFEDDSIFIEASGASDSLHFLRRSRGVTALAFGFHYEDMPPGLLVSNENCLLTSLGADRTNFEESCSLLRSIDDFRLLPFYKMCKFEDILLGFEATRDLREKIILEH